MPVSRTATVTPCPVSPCAARRSAPVSWAKVPLGVDVVEKDGQDVADEVLRKDTAPPDAEAVAAAPAAAPAAANAGDANPIPNVPVLSRAASRAGQETPKRLLSQLTPLLWSSIVIVASIGGRVPRLKELVHTVVDRALCVESYSVISGHSPFPARVTSHL